MVGELSGLDFDALVTGCKGEPEKAVQQGASGAAGSQQCSPGEVGRVKYATWL